MSSFAVLIKSGGDISRLHEGMPLLQKSEREKPDRRRTNQHTGCVPSLC